MPTPLAPSARSPRLARTALLALTLLQLICLLPFAARAQETGASPLETGRAVERDIAAGSVHSYSLKLNAGQYARLNVERRAGGVDATLYAPDGRELMDGIIFGDKFGAGLLNLSTVAEAAGEFRLEVKLAAENEAKTARYTVRLEERRAATDRDRQLAAAERAQAEAIDLSELRTEEGWRKALVRYEEARALYETAGEMFRVAGVLSDTGLVYYSLVEPERALEYLERSVKAYQELKERHYLGEAYATGNIGAVYNNLMGNARRGLEYKMRALAIVRESGAERRAEAGFLNDISGVHMLLGEVQKAEEASTQALALARSIGDRRAEAQALYGFGNIQTVRGERQKAHSYFEQALAVSRAAGSRLHEGTTLYALGDIYGMAGDRKKSLEFYRQALPILEALNEQRHVAIVNYGLGKHYLEIGEMPQALKHLETALLMARAVRFKQLEILTLNLVAVASNRLGEKQKALEYYQQALAEARRSSNRMSEANVLNNLASIYSSLGEKERALEIYRLALKLFRTIFDRQGEANTVANIGTVYNDTGELTKGLDHFNQALSIFQEIGERPGQSAMLGNIGKTYLDLGEKEKALDHLNRALALKRETGDRPGEAEVLNNLGEVYQRLTDEKQPARRYYEQALALAREVGVRGTEAILLYNLATFEREARNLDGARRHIESALDIVERVRTNIASQELRASYFATMQMLYEFYIDLLMRLHKERPAAGFDGMALRASERARARSLLEMLGEAQADIRQGVEPRLLEREREMQRALNAKAERQLHLLSGKHTPEEAAEVAREIESLTAAYQEVRAEIRRTSPRYAALTQPAPLDLKEIQTQVLDGETLLLEYALGKEQSYLWVVSRTAIKSFELPGRAAIEQATREAYALLDARNQRPAGETAEARQQRVARADAKYLEAATELGRMILAPAAGLLGRKRLVFVADGALQYVPFGALPVPQTQAAQPGAKTETDFVPLIAEHEIATLPSASTLAVLRKETAARKPAPKAVAVLADPVFTETDERVEQRAAGSTAGPANSPAASATEGRPEVASQQEVASPQEVAGRTRETAALKVPRLPATRREAEQIMALVGAEGGKQALDFEASRRTATSGELAQYRYLHFATHGSLNSVHPELTGILFSLVDRTGAPQDGFLRAHEIFNLRLPAELVVLSACQTGLGKEIRGEGLVGLTRGFMYAGSPRVVVSLWSVSDRATAELMARFYRGMLKERQTPAAALRRAQLAMWKEGQWRAPFYWAAFTLQGEWR